MLRDAALVCGDVARRGRPDGRGRAIAEHDDSYTLQGDMAKARTAYEDFLALWKDADPDIPTLKQAKAEYAKLT